MAPWLIPALKVVLPHVISAAAPAFTRKAPGAAPEPALVQKQIAELQSAAAQNAANLQELAAQLQATVEAVNRGAAQAEARLRRAVLLAAGAAALSLTSVGVALIVLFAR